MKTSLRLSIVVLLAASHGVNDFLAGWLLGGQMPSTTVWDRLPWLVIYAGLAFAGQLPAAWLMDRSPRRDGWLAGALVLMVVAVALSSVAPGVAVIASGIASAFCHVAGGAIALQLPRGERALGWFTAPGVLGLAVGGWCGHTQGNLALWAAALPLALLVGWVALRPHWPRLETGESRVPTPAVDAHDGLMLLMLLALTLRSALWDLVQVTQMADPYVLFALAASAAFGKVLGGWMISRWPSVRQVGCTLMVSCFLLEFARGHLLALCAGVALLQSSIPASIVLLHRSFGTSATRATAYGLGLTVAMGGFILPFQIDFSVMVLVVAVAAIVLFLRSERPLDTEPAR